MARAGEKVNFISYLDLIKWTIWLSQQLSVPSPLEMNYNSNSEARSRYATLFCCLQMGTAGRTWSSVSEDSDVSRAEGRLETTGQRV